MVMAPVAVAVAVAVVAPVAVAVAVAVVAPVAVAVAVVAPVAVTMAVAPVAVADVAALGKSGAQRECKEHSTQKDLYQRSHLRRRRVAMQTM